MEVQIPGGTAELRDRLTVGGRDSVQLASISLATAIRKVRPDLDVDKLSELQALPDDAIDESVVAALHRITRAGIVALLKSWTRPDALPTMATIDDMDPEVYDALAAATAPLIARASAGSRFGPDGAKDPDSPTEPSPVSADGARAQAVPSIDPTPAPSASIENTATAASSAD